MITFSDLSILTLTGQQSEVHLLGMSSSSIVALNWNWYEYNTSCEIIVSGAVAINGLWIFSTHASITSLSMHFPDNNTQGSTYIDNIFFSEFVSFTFFQISCMKLNSSEAACAEECQDPCVLIGYLNPCNINHFYAIKDFAPSDLAQNRNTNLMIVFAFHAESSLVQRITHHTSAFAFCHRRTLTLER